MKYHLQLAALALIGLCCNEPQQAHAQTTWTVGNTTLTETNLVTGISLPWEILWGPDDMIWCSTRVGRVLRIDPFTGTYNIVLDKTSEIYGSGSGEPGMLGMALHPDWANTPQVFVVYNFGSGFNVKERLSVFDWDGTALVNEEILIDNIPGAQIHNGSRLLITPDNKILMTTGDTGDGGTSSQNLASINGKVLRINLDGSIPSDNPDPTSYVWSFGHRNGQGLCLGPNGIIYESEHGQNNSDEFNIIEPNRNYGWPNVQGACNTANEITFCENNNVKEPLMEWSPCVAVNGIEYYNHPAIPEWQHSVIMGVMGGLGGTSGNKDRVSVLHLSPDGLTVTGEDQYFTSLNQRFRDICINPYTGAVYVALNGTSYPGNGPNQIKEFRNLAFNSVEYSSKQPSQDINLYPSPARDKITVQLSPAFTGSTLDVIAFSGDVVNKVKVSGETLSIDVSRFARGNYFIRVSSAQGTITRTFVVE